MNEKWFEMDVSQIEKKLKTNAASGLSRKAARSAWRFYAPKSGRLFAKKQKPARSMLVEIISDFALVLLLLSSFLAIFFDERMLGYTVSTILCASLVVSFFIYYRAQRSVERMEVYFEPLAKVIRGGKLYRTSFDNIVPGDVILLEKGDIVCADARLVTSDKLRVAMRVSEDKYVSLQKQAQAIGTISHNDPTKQTNILHGGSIIEEGSARAIVYAVGKYTYLGARLGEIYEKFGDNVPIELKKLKKICSQVSMLSMALVLPLCIFSLVISHMSGGNATLSGAFLTALAIAASSLTQFSCTLCKIFFVRHIRRLACSDGTAAVRTTEAFDKLLGLKYLFVLDGSALTDGALHFDGAFSADGDIKNVSQKSATLDKLSEAAALYCLAEANCLTLGVSQPERYRSALEEFLISVRGDVEAVKIRNQIVSYSPANLSDPVDRVFYSNGTQRMVLEVSCSDELIANCQYALLGSRLQLLSSVGADKLKHYYAMNTIRGKTILLFSEARLSDSGHIYDRCLIGGIALKEHTDTSASNAINAFKRSEVKVISFVSDRNNGHSPQIPAELKCGAFAHKRDFVSHNVPITYKLGEFDVYFGFEERDILALMKEAQSKKQGVGVISFSDEMPTLLQNADVFISCAPIIDLSSVRSEEELYTLESEGTATSASALQTVKSEADILISRPSSNGRGGLSSLCKAINCSKIALRNLNNFVAYVFAAQILRICLAVIPMLSGVQLLDARHIVLCSFIIDLFALLMFASDKRTALGASPIKTPTIKLYAINNKLTLLCVVAASLLGIALPIAMDYLGFMGPYLYRREYLLCVLLWMHIALIYYLAFGGIKNLFAALRSKPFAVLCVAVVAFLVCAHLFLPFGRFFGVSSNPIPYLILSFVIPMAFALMLFAVNRAKRR